MTGDEIKKMFLEREKGFFNYLRARGKDPETYEPAQALVSTREQTFALIDEAEAAGDEFSMHRISKMAQDIDAFLPYWKLYVPQE